MENTENIYYVYEHYIPGYGVFYVGKGKGGRATEKHGRNRHWKSVVAKHGPFDVRIIKRDMSEIDAYLYEKEVIVQYKQNNAKLTNIAEGGIMTIFKPGSLVKLSEQNKGINNPGADKKVYEFCSIDGETFTGTQCGFSEKYGFKICHLLGENPQNHLRKGWYLKSRQDDPEVKFQLSLRLKHTFYHKNGEIFEGSRLEFSAKYKMSASALFDKIENGIPTLFGWAIDPKAFERKIHFNADQNIYRFENIKTQEIFTGTRFDFLSYTGINNIDYWFRKDKNDLALVKRKTKKIWKLLGILNES